jgi:hypothetical protein
MNLSRLIRLRNSVCEKTRNSEETSESKVTSSYNIVRGRLPSEQAAVKMYYGPGPTRSIRRLTAHVHFFRPAHKLNKTALCFELPVYTYVMVYNFSRKSFTFIFCLLMFLFLLTFYEFFSV